jgi:4'-phosphopantetheinyl transferase
MNTDHFIRSVRGALAEAGFQPPGRGESRTIVFACGSFPAMAAPVAAAVLDAGEAGRAARFRFERDRTRYILAHAVWRVALSECVGAAPARVPLVATPAGQPTLPGTGFGTSLSHAGDWVAVAVTGDALIGIDIEQLPSRVRLADMVETICTPAEAARVMALDAASRERALLALWTRKEALLKAFGLGLGVDPAGFDAGAGEAVPPPPAAAGLPPCRVLPLDLPAGLVGTLALPAGGDLVGQHRLGSLSD